MKRTFLVALCLLLAGAARAACDQLSPDDPVAKQPNKSREGFVDFALKQVNPRNTDYGRQVDEARKMAVDQTIKNVDSWAVLVAVGFLVLSFLMVLHQHRERSRREAIAAKLLAQYHNAWVDARDQAARAIRRYNQLVHTANSASEAAFRPPSSEAGAARARAVKADLDRGAKPQSAVIAAPPSDIRVGQYGAGSSHGLRQNREPEVDLIAQITTLQQQLNASHEREKNLQKELNKGQRRAPALQPRDANLPG